METRAWSPDKLLKVSGYYWRSFALHAAIKLGIFTIISSEELTCEDIAQSLGAKKRGVVMLLNALAAMDLLVKKGDCLRPSCNRTIRQENNREVRPY